MNLQELQQNLPNLMNLKFVNKQLVEVYEPPVSFIKEGMLFVSAENGDDACDYYGEFRGGFPYINPALEEFAAKNGGAFQWQNPSCIVFVQE